MTNRIPSKARRKAQIALLVLGGCLAALVVAEVGLRVVLRVRGKPFDSEVAHKRFDDLWSSVTQFVPRLDRPSYDIVPGTSSQVRVLHPYYGWDETGAMEILPVELEYARQREGLGDYVVLIVGGSVADMFGHFGVPRLQERLSADPRFAGRNLRFLSYGHGGFKQPQQLNMVQFQFGMGLHVDAVLLIDGFNEVAIGNQNVGYGTSPLFPSIPHWGSLARSSSADPESLDLAIAGREAQRAVEVGARRASQWGAYHSAIASHLMTSQLESLKRKSRASYDGFIRRLNDSASSSVLHGPPFQEDIRINMRSAVRMWLECSRTMRALCEARGIHFVHALQPTLLDPDSKTPTDEEKALGVGIKPWIEGVTVGYPLLRQGGNVLSAEGEAFLDATGIFRDVHETIYIDSCHFGRPGNEMFADRIADVFLESLPK